jgi:hypothetical protein
MYIGKKIGYIFDEINHIYSRKFETDVFVVIG